MYNNVHPKQKVHAPLISKDTYEIVCENSERLNSAIIYDRDYSYNFFGFKTLEKSYLMRIAGMTFSFFFFEYISMIFTVL